MVNISMQINIFDLIITKVSFWRKTNKQNKTKQNMIVIRHILIERTLNRKNLEEGKHGKKSKIEFSI